MNMNDTPSTDKAIFFDEPVGTDRTIVALSATVNRDYDFLVVLSALFWRDLIGHTPAVLLVGPEKLWNSGQADVVLHALLRHRISFQIIPAAEGYSACTTAQNARQHLVATKIEAIADDDWIMPADADLWPLRKSAYQYHVGSKFRAVVAPYANGDFFQGKAMTLKRAAYGLRSQTLPICHVAMRARDWRAIYAPIDGDISGSVKQSLDGWLPSKSEDPDKNMTLWCSDQQYMTEALCMQSWFPEFRLDDKDYDGVFAVKTPGGSVLFVTRAGHPPVDRLDRAVESWRKTYGAFDKAKWLDAHLHKAPDEAEHWADELEIIDALMPQHSAWAREYRDEYVSKP